MAARGLIALETLGASIRAEMDISKGYSEFANGVSNLFLKVKTELLANEKLQHKRIVEETYHWHFPEVQLALPPSQLPKQISDRTDGDRLSVNEVFSCIDEQECRTREFHFEVAQEGKDLTGQW